MKNAELIDVIKKCGLKTTKHRISILDIIEQSEQPMTIEQVFFRLQKENIFVNLSTVYRVFDIFVKKNIVKKLNISSENHSMFEYNRMVHSHYLICLVCKKCLAINHCPIGDYEESLRNETKYLIAGHKLEIYGYCPECR